MSCGNLWDMGSQTTMNAQRPKICGSRKIVFNIHAHHVTIGNFKGGKKLSSKIRILKGKFDRKPEVSVVRRREFNSFMEEYQLNMNLFWNNMYAVLVAGLMTNAIAVSYTHLTLPTSDLV